MNLVYWLLYLRLRDRRNLTNGCFGYWVNASSLEVSDEMFFERVDFLEIVLKRLCSIFYLLHICRADATRGVLI